MATDAIEIGRAPTQISVGDAIPAGLLFPAGVPGESMGAGSAYDISADALIAAAVKKARAPIVVGTVAELKQIDGVVKQVYETVGSISANGVGAARYLCVSLVDARLEKSDPVWEPGGAVDHYFANGTVAQLITSGSILYLSALGLEKSLDATAIYDQACEYLSARSGGVVVLPPGDLVFSKLTLRNRISVIGMGEGVTNIIPASSVESGDYGLLEIDSGPVQYVNAAGFTIWGNTAKSLTALPLNTEQIGLYLQAKFSSSGAPGGFWNGKIAIGILGFKYGAWSRGGYSTAHSKLPNQLLDFRQTKIIRTDTTDGYSLRLTGQQAQIAFKGGYADCRDPGTKRGANIQITHDPSPIIQSTENGESGSDIAGTGNAVRTPHNVSFLDGFTTQNAERGFYIWNSIQIKIDGAYFENIGKSVTAETNSIVSIGRCNFQNAADFGGAGYLYYSGSGCQVDWGDGYVITGIVDEIGKSIAATAAISPHGGAHRANTDGFFQSMGVRQVTVAGNGSIDAKGHNFIYCANNADASTRLSEVSSQIMIGQSLKIMCLAGNITVSTTGNIRPFAAGVSELTFGKNNIIELVRAHGGADQWVLISTPILLSTTVPTDGYFYARGTQINRANATLGAAAGWVVTTEGLAGSSAVLGALSVVSS